MSKLFLYRTLFAVVVLGFCTSARAQADETLRIVRSSDVVHLAAMGNPELRAALLDQDRAALAVRAEQGLYPFVLQLDGGATHQSTPMAATNGSIAHRSVDQLALGATLNKTLPVGTSFSLEVDGARGVAGGPTSPINPATTSEPTYNLSARFSVAQPLLRGAGKRVGEASLRQAMAAQEVSKCNARRSTSELARSVLGAYWELWYAQQALDIDGRARDMAQAQLEETGARVEQGAAAPADLLPFQTRLATLEETVIAAAAERDRLAVQLEMITGLLRENVRVAPDLEEQPPDASRNSSAAALAAALENAPAVREASAQLYAAQEMARTAGEAERQKLDLVSWIEAQTLGAGQVSPVFTQYGEGDAYSAYLGLSYELPLSDQRRTAQRAAAELDVQIARQRLVSATDQARSEVATALRAVDNARLRVELAHKTLAVAKEQAEAQRQRAAVGAAIFVDVRDAEEAVRESALRVTRAQVDLWLAQLSLDSATGDLLARVES